jgi:hypothetical protein
MVGQLQAGQVAVADQASMRAAERAPPAAPAAPRDTLKGDATDKRAPTLLGHLLQPLAHHRLLIVVQLLGIRHLLQHRRGIGAKLLIQNAAVSGGGILPASPYSRHATAPVGRTLVATR